MKKNKEGENTFHEPHKRIHKLIRKHHPQSVKKVKKILTFKYPKLLLMIILILFAYSLFTRPFISEWIETFNSFSYFGVFIAGILIAFGFSAPFGIGLLIKLNLSNVLLATILGGIGGMIVDLIIFKTAKLSFMDEFKRLEKTKVIKKIEDIVKKNKHVVVVHYLLYIFAGLLIATPLPDEIGISMLAGLTTIKPVPLAIISFLLHSLFIFLMLLI